MIARLLLAAAALVGVTALTTWVLTKPGTDGYVVYAERVTAGDVYAWASVASPITIIAGLVIGALLTWPIARGVGYTQAERDQADERADAAEKPKPLFADRPVPVAQRPHNPLLSWAARARTALRRGRAEVARAKGDEIPDDMDRDDEARLSAAVANDRSTP